MRESTSATMSGGLAQGGAWQDHEPWRTLGVLALVALALGWLHAGPLWAAGIHSNGRGGGAWSDPATWHGNTVPQSDDRVVIATRDRVVFDLHHPEQATCQALYIDPEGVLSFAARRGARTLSIAGPIEAYGVLQLDGTQHRDDVMTLRLVGESESDRRVILRQHAALLAYGHEHRREGEPPNVRILTAPVQPSPKQASLPQQLAPHGRDDAPKDAPDTHRDDAPDTASPEQATPTHTPLPGRIEADEDAIVDLQRGVIRDLLIDARHLDNTGSNPSERFNLVENRILGLARLHLRHCDTPAIRGNVFEPLGHGGEHAAIRLDHGSLADVAQNVIVGPYKYGLFLYHDTDAAPQANLIRDCQTGIWARVENLMARGNRIVDCPKGFVLDQASGVVEQTAVANARQAAFELHRSEIQFNSSAAQDIPEGAHGMRLVHSHAQLLNCNLADDVIRCEGRPPGDKPFAQSMQHLVAKVQPASEAVKLPRRIMVAVQTAKVSGGVPKGKADLNVRNSPAPVGSRGLTPLPRSTRPLIVRSWSLNRKGKRENAPFYDLKVLGPAAKPGQPPVVLHQQQIEPNETWFRPEPNEPEPTMVIRVPHDGGK